MSQFAANNPLSRKLQQQAGKQIGKFVSEQTAKHGPKVIEAAQSFANGARGGPSGATPVKNTATNKVAHEVGGLSRDMATDKPKKEFEKQGKQLVNNTASTVQNKPSQPKPNTVVKPSTGPVSALNKGKPINGVNINRDLNKPFKPMTMGNAGKPGKPIIANVKPNPSKPNLGRLGKFSPDTTKE
jgi:hypothetical protein